MYSENYRKVCANPKRDGRRRKFGINLSHENKKEINGQLQKVPEFEIPTLRTMAESRHFGSVTLLGIS